MTREMEDPGAVALRGWVASMGNETSRERSARTTAGGRLDVRRNATGTGMHGQDSGAGFKPEGVAKPVKRLGTPDVGTAKRAGRAGAEAGEG